MKKDINHYIVIRNCLWLLIIAAILYYCLRACEAPQPSLGIENKSFCLLESDDIIVTDKFGEVIKNN